MGHTEAIVTGTLAGHNASQCAMGLDLLEIPRSLACGDAISFVRESMRSKEGLSRKYTFSGSVYFDRMKALGLYSTDVRQIAERVAGAGMTGTFAARPR